MLVLVDKNSILNLFGVDTFGDLESILDTMSPSLVEYHLSNFLNSEDLGYFNKKDIENSFYIGDYSLYLDYNKNIFLETNELKEDTQTLSLW
ncbi:hypothetical protein CRU87_02175 [Aliarcobacter trophiarum LMG 25534]|uniref:Uncharacterized protein n=1 Tax=Aliarcobacter trophiarum LMG 25534 TaxID=1032241 RepID=A0AAD0VLZ8_9BACT|nr:hypothetical protein [Aliarcobacter trophiarum]AXK48873.1 hypothetical protein ATR_1009 [Aliarcobacter trophiarum LMG 25534]RXI24950.1 hypothetical protein CRU89_09055 [Aliarcobacter trophiarum]RXJ92608.1 hypothetical protein CRU87_02175 [Aliarcobacter trophiarum LMG 25534]